MEKMLNILSGLSKHYILSKPNYNYVILNVRTFLSQAYYCQEAWEHRLNNPILQRVNLHDLYYDLDQRYQKTRQMSAVDVDIFVNATTDASYTDEILDLVHKLRLSGDTGNTLKSTSHALLRLLLKFENKDMLNVLDDRLNYGLFLDFYTANLLLDTYWKNKNYTSGARTASQLMLQEEFSHPISNSLSVLHCYNYLLHPDGWPEHPKLEEPEEEEKIRVKFLRNPYDDCHFDLKDANRIVGKTLVMFTNKKIDPLSTSLNLLGHTLYDVQDLVQKTINEYVRKNIILYKEIKDLIPEKYQKEIADLRIDTADVLSMLKSNVEQAVQKTSENDIAEQCKKYSEWETERINALEEQKKRLHIAKRLSDIEDLKAAMKEKETKLWFFENEEKIELAIEAKKTYYPKRWFGKKKKPKRVDESYIPPEVQANQTTQKI